MGGIDFSGKNNFIGEVTRTYRPYMQELLLQFIAFLWLAFNPDANGNDISAIHF